MGYMTIAYALNDLFTDITRSPNTIAESITNPPLSAGDREDRRHWDMVCHMANRHGERIPNPQALRVLPTFHSNNTMLVAVGGNYATVLHTTYGYSHHTDEDKLRLVKEMARDLGYNLVKRNNK